MAKKYLILVILIIGLCAILFGYSQLLGNNDEDESDQIAQLEQQIIDLQNQIEDEREQIDRIDDSTEVLTDTPVETNTCNSSAARNMCMSEGQACQIFGQDFGGGDNCFLGLKCDGSGPDGTTGKCIKSNQPQEIIPSSVQPYENDYISIDLIRGWNVQEVENVVKTGGINITKDNYILYVNPNASQASGAPDGRFSEIAIGAPGADLVMKSYPADPCGEKQETLLDNRLIVNDYYISNSILDNSVFGSNCNRLTSNKAVWYFSYASNGGYFGDATKMNPSIAGEMRQFVITMSYSTDDINNLPEKGSESLDQNLDEMQKMINSIRFKE